MKFCNYCNIGFPKSKKESLSQWEARRFCGRKCSALSHGERMVGGSSWMKGKKHSEESKKKNSVAHLGEKSYRWKGGVSKVAGYYPHKAMERYARLIGAEGTFTLGEWEQVKRDFKYCCAHCHQNKKLTKDHIIPLSRGGTNYISNIQPLCQSCNSIKNNKLPYA